MTSDAAISITFVDADNTRHHLLSEPGLSVMEVLRTAGLLDGECGGSLACATCHVWVDAAFEAAFEAPSEEEEDMLDVAFNLSRSSRLSCQLKVSKDINGLTISRPK
ncbi:2Fe-2S iron-sulfur cluster-binding protein [Tropicimonas marinistellae]|uniref:2Fe-2S iron-sulfur cluster-binding protein n=1 Tax=Tropicimonas marinistellae TaxID=1739787 RepID=UPI00082B98F5|nr:2Fe-2S iron-sulfur cluster-binding protein [Tropicimonas marinistellae]